MKVIFINLYLINLITCELDLTYTKFYDTTRVIYKIDLFTDGREIVFNLLDDAYFITPYVIDTIPNSPDGH